jgi:integrase
MPRSPKIPITLETAERRMRHLRAFASALVHEGVPLNQITALAVLSIPEHFNKGVRFLWNRAGRRPTPLQRETYSAVRYMSQYWAGADPTVVRVMAKAAARCRRRSAGITDKSLAILQQFDDPVKRERLYRLPRLIVGLAAGVSNRKTAALLVQRAVAIDLLLVAPMRLKNLVGLFLDRHFVATRRNGQRHLRLVIPREEVKNLVPLSFPLPADTTELLDFYVRRYRPILVAGRPTRALFPGNTKGHVHSSLLSGAITRLIQRYTGILMHVHAFRHLAAKLFLERHPFRYDLVALLLGHRSIETTRKFYCALEMQAVSREYSAEILGREIGDGQPGLAEARFKQGTMPLPPGMDAGATRAVSVGLSPIQLHRINQRRVPA